MTGTDVDNLNGAAMVIKFQYLPRPQRSPDHAAFSWYSKFILVDPVKQSEGDALTGNVFLGHGHNVGADDAARLKYVSCLRRSCTYIGVIQDFALWRENCVLKARASFSRSVVSLFEHRCQRPSSTWNGDYREGFP